MQQPVGFYHDSTPSLSKVAFFLGKIEVAYRLTLVDIAKRDQHPARLRALNPNGESACGDPRMVSRFLIAPPFFCTLARG